MKKMIHVYKEGKGRLIDIKGSGEELLLDFAAICGTLANSITESSKMPESDVVSLLSVTMAQGISERRRHERKEV